MIKRVYFPLVVLFWATMNVLLWRSEMSGSRNAGSTVPLANVWERILTAPDDSSLQIFQRGEKIGFCRWVATVTETAASAPSANGSDEIEGRIRRVAGYHIDLDGNFRFDDTAQRLRFATHTEFGANQAWRKFQFRLNLKPNQWEVNADAAAERVKFRTEDGGSPFEREFTFAELARPENVLGTFGLPVAYAWLGELTQGFRPTNPAQLALGLKWEARNDWLNIGHSRLRVYRVEARLFDKYRAVVFVSRVGEILRVELPGDLLLVNEALTSL